MPAPLSEVNLRLFNDRVHLQGTSSVSSSRLMCIRLIVAASLMLVLVNWFCSPITAFWTLHDLPGSRTAEAL